MEKGGESNLSYCCEKGNLEVLKFLVSKGADVKKQKFSLMKISCQNGHLNLVKYFVESQKVDVNALSSRGETLLFTAACYGRLEIIEYLVSNSADVNKACTDGKTPLMAAARHDKLEIVKFLVKKGANFNKPSNSGETSLSLALEERNLTIVKFFVEEKKCKINMSDLDSDTSMGLMFSDIDLN